MKKTLCMLVVLGLAAFMDLSGCSGGGGGGGGTGTGSPTVSGTVASGSALGGVTVTLKDSLGSSATATTGTDGKYSIDTTGLTAPFLVLVTSPTGTKFYSVSADANTASTINITPLTDIIIRSWYSVQGGTIGAAFANPTAAGNAPPSPTTVAVINSVVQNIVQLWLDQAGVTGTVNLISTPFTANGTGIDQVLDQTTVNTATGQLTITGGGVTQNTSVTATGGAIGVSTTTTGTTGTSSSSDSVVVPYQTAQQTALDGITSAANSFASTVNANGSSLVASDLYPFLDTTGLYSGYSYTQWAGELAYNFKGKTISFSNIAIKSLGATTADVVFRLSQSQGGQTSTSPQELFFKNIGGSWLLTGDNRIANVEVRTAMVRNQGSANNVNLVVEVNVDSPRSNPAVASLSGVTITGGPWSSASLSYDTLNSAPWDNSLKSDAFGIYALDPPSISSGETFTLALTPSAGSPVTYAQSLNAITTESIMITNLTGTTIAYATAAPLTVQWTLPKTFAISYIRLGTSVTSPGNPLNKCDDQGNQVVLGITSTQALNITVPATCAGVPINWAEIYLQVYGINGELSQVYYTFQ